MVGPTVLGSHTYPVSEEYELLVASMREVLRLLSRRAEARRLEHALLRVQVTRLKSALAMLTRLDSDRRVGPWTPERRAAQSERLRRLNAVGLTGGRGARMRREDALREPLRVPQGGPQEGPAAGRDGARAV